MSRPTRSELTCHSELLASSERSEPLLLSLVREGLHSAAYAGLQAPISGALQLVDRAIGTQASETVVNGLLRVGIAAPPEAQFNSPRWHFQQIGAAVGMTLPLWFLHKGVGRLSTTAFGKAETLRLSGALPSRVLGEAAATGALFDGVFRPVDPEGDFLAARSRNALSGALTFATLTGTTLGISQIAASNRGLLGTILRSDQGQLLTPVMAGLSAGFVSAESSSLLQGRRFASSPELFESMYTMSLVGLTFAGARAYLGTTNSERVLNERLPSNSKPAEAVTKPCDIEQAARDYFGKKASELDLAESTFLASIIERRIVAPGAVNKAPEVSTTQQGILSEAAARRIGNPDLAGATVDYVLRPEGRHARDVFFQNRRLAGSVSVGTQDGILPLKIPETDVPIAAVLSADQVPTQLRQNLRWSPRSSMQNQESLQR